MTGFFHFARFCAVALACALAYVPSADAAERSRTFVGTPVSQVLDNLRPQGLTFIYNTRLIPTTMRVEAEPDASRGLALAEQILAAHGLAALPGRDCDRCADRCGGEWALLDEEG